MDGIGSCRNSHYLVGLDHTDIEVTLVRVNGGVGEVESCVDFWLTVVVCVCIWVVRVVGREVDALSDIVEVVAEFPCCWWRYPAVYEW